MNPVSSLVPLVLIASLAAQDVEASLTNTSRVGVFALITTQSIAANQTLTSPFSLGASVPGVASASLEAVFRNGTQLDDAGVNFTWSAQSAFLASAGTTATQLPLFGDHAYALRLSAAQPVQGDLRISFNGNAGLNGSATASITVGSATHDFAAGGSNNSATVPGLTVDGAGLTVTIRLRGEARSTLTDPGSFSAGLEVAFVPAGRAGCRVLSHESSCGQGGSLSGRAQRTGQLGADLTLTMGGGAANGFGATILSPLPDTLDLLGTGCKTFVTPVPVGLFQTDANGGATTVLPVPLGLDYSFYVHQLSAGLELTGLRWGTTNSLKVECTAGS
ncbi:MAG: hypothetical protein R3F56_12825 [Planctomycetota bacterium]